MVSIPVLVNRAFPARRVPRNYISLRSTLSYLLFPHFFFFIIFMGSKNFGQILISRTTSYRMEGEEGRDIYIRLRVIDLSLNGEGGKSYEAREKFVEMSSACYSRALLIESNDLRAQCNRQLEIPRRRDRLGLGPSSTPMIFLLSFVLAECTRTKAQRAPGIEDSTPNRNVIIKQPFIRR